MSKKCTLKWLTLLLLCFGTIQLKAQQQTASGKVVDAEGSGSLPGVSVLVKGTTQGVATDLDGNFSIPANVGDTLQFSFLGYQTQEIVFRGGTINVQLQPDLAQLNEVVVIGYGTQKKKDLTGSITTISTEDFVDAPISSPEQLIMGKVAGVQITTSGGAPGSGSRIRIRGGASLNASNDPLIVIDGVPIANGGISGSANALNLINPNDIASFNILKDASAAAIYGSRASNGVIIITTKEGSSDKLKVNFQTTQSLSNRVGGVDVLSADQFRDIVNSRGSETQIALLGDANTDWQDEIYKSSFGTDNNISISGGIKNLPYRISMGYLDKDGILTTDNLQRTTASLNLSPSFLDDHLKVDVNLKGSMSKNHFANQGAIANAIRFDPTKPVRVDSSDFGGYFEWMEGEIPDPLSPRNPVALLQLEENESDVKRSIGNIQLDYRFHFLPELRANLNLGYDISKGKGTVFAPAEAGFVYARKGMNNQYEQEKSNKLLDFYLNYAKDLPSIDSRFDIMAGYTYQDFISSSQNFANREADGTVIAPLPSRPENKTQNTLISYFGRLNYALKDRYLLTLTLRRDGSSRFSENNRWGMFPSAAFAWRLTEEEFLKNNEVLTNLKLRLGYGVTGQQDIGSDYPYLPGYTIGDSTAMYKIGDSWFLTYRPNAYDENIKWEETTTYNVGLDYGFLDGRISGSIDYYLKKTEDLLSVVPIPVGSNFSNQLLTNVGNMENRGLEFVLNAVPVINDRFTWDLGFNITFNKSEITNLTKVEDPNFTGIDVGGVSGGTGTTIQNHSIGYEPYSFMVYKQVYDENGNPIQDLYVDMNDDGTVNELDRYRYQSPEPEMYLGFSSQFNYDNWSLAFTLRGSFGNYMYNNVNSAYGVYREILNPGGFLSNGSTNVFESNFGNNQYRSDYYIENASFVRMDNINLGYNFGEILQGKARLRLMGIVQNVFVLTKYGGLDPEIAGGIDNNLYPRPRTFSLGLNLDF